MNSLAPISSGDRIEIIDIIRGFAILGIFLVNMGDFHSPWLYLEVGKLWTSPIDIGADIFVDIFAQSSFYTLFSFLFGFGMVIIKERMTALNYSFYKLFLRRMFWLLVFGLIHAFLIWHGDILISYAGIGLLLLIFHKAKPRTLLIFAFSIIAFSVFIIGRRLLLIELSYPYEISRYYPEMVEKSLYVYGSGSYLEITSQRITDWLAVSGGNGFLYLTAAILPMFLLGAFAAKKKIFENLEENYYFIKNVWLGSLIVGFGFKLMPYIIGQGITVDYLQGAIGGPATAIFYASSIILMSRKAFWQRKLRFFAAVGRLSLSNYLFQSIVGTLIFYSYGLGLYGKVSPFFGLLLVAGIYTIQVLLSKWWIARFRIGPVEWLWRSLTYGSRQKFRRVRDDNSRLREVN